MFLLQDSNPIGDALNNTEWAFPMAECFHIVGFGIALGTVILVDIRMMGLGLNKQTAAYLLKQTWLYHLFSLMVVIFSGLALFLSDPKMYERNIGFRYKITLLVVAILYNFTIHNRVAASGSSGGGAKLVAFVSVVLWLSVVFGGIFIAFL